MNKNFRNLKTKHGEYRVIETEDGSQTLYSPLYDENCHSVSGAYEETIHNYVRGCEVISKLDHSDITILEIGLGVGLGVLCTFNETRNSKNKVEFITTEIDAELAKWVLEQGPLSTIVNSFKASENKIEATLNDHFKLIVLLGDARKTVPLLDKTVDCIYMDAFSPRKNRTLWTKQWFRNLRSLCNNQSIMTTYSAAVRIRKAMLEADFHPTNTKGHGQKNSITKAYTTDQFADAELEAKLIKSITPALSDEENNDE